MYTGGSLLNMHF